MCMFWIFCSNPRIYLMRSGLYPTFSSQPFRHVLRIQSCSSSSSEKQTKQKKKAFNNIFFNFVLFIFFYFIYLFIYLFIFSGFLFTTAKVMSVTAMIFFLSNSYFLQFKYDIRLFILSSLPFTGLFKTDQITNSQLAC